MAENSYKFFCNRDCMFFPCHTDVDEDNFNCMFCYCPLYSMGDKCGGRFTYTPQGIKDCSACSFPHHPESYGVIQKRLADNISEKQK